MTPGEWKDWLIGGQDRLLDIKENNLHMATANGIVESGKRLTGMYNEIKQQRYKIRNKEDEYFEEKRRAKEQRKYEREAFLRGAQRFLKNQ